MYLLKSNPLPSRANSLSCSSAEIFPPPNVNLQKLSDVYSDINLFDVVIYVPTLIPGWSDTFVGSSIKTLSWTKASTSYHLSGPNVKKSCGFGIVENWVPDFNKTLVIPKIFFSGKNNSKYGLTSFGVITLLKTFVIPLTTTSLFTIV